MSVYTGRQVGKTLNKRHGLTKCLGLASRGPLQQIGKESVLNF